jgi:PHD/YefM family antitoxin component YafN of YafNO toxin-antitoxin module
MIEVTSSEFAKRFARYRQAAQREPVAVTHHSRVTEVLLSKQDYDEYMRLKAMETKALMVSELSEDAVQALAASHMDARHAALDALMDD